jgi:hypothetical protein
VRRSGRLSLVVFALVLVMLLSLACVASFGIMDMLRAFEAGGAFHLSSMCN